MSMFSILATPLGFAMHWLYLLVQNYGWTIIIFTVVVRLAMFPLTLKQQKSTARMSAFQPMIQEIQKKWATDKNKQNAELQKFYEENDLKMTGGCAPMLVNMLVLFGVIAVIQAPLNYIIRMPAQQISYGAAIVQTYSEDTEFSKNVAVMESRLIGEIRENSQRFIDGAEVIVGDDGKAILLQEGQKYQDGNIIDKNGKVVVEGVVIKHVALEQEWVDAVVDFKFDFLGMNLSVSPKMELSIYIILPILSIFTMFASQFIVMKTSGQEMQGKNTMWIMTISMGAFFGWYAFTVPVGFSLYYTISNLVTTLQQLMVKKLHDPAKVKEEIMLEIEERKKAKKAKKEITYKDETGEVVTAALSEAELAKIRLQKARELDAKRYGSSEEEITESEKLASEKAKQQDAEKYGTKKESKDS